MKKLLLLTAALVLLAIQAGADVSVNIYGAAAPNVYGSPSFAPWWDNAQTAIRAGLTNWGSGNAEYIQLSSTGGASAPQPGYQAIVTGFDSWHGIAGGTGERGTRIHFIYHIKATAGESLALANISGIDVLENGWGDTNYSLFTAFYGAPVSFDSSTTFDALRRVGYKADGTKVTSGNDMTGITEIIGTFGMAYAAYFPNTYYGGTTPQEELDLAIADIEANLQCWKGVLTYAGTTVDTTVNFVPEPSSIITLLGGLAGIAGLRRRKA